jgi:hypothetical protein
MSWVSAESMRGHGGYGSGPIRLDIPSNFSIIFERTMMAIAPTVSLKVVNQTTKRNPEADDLKSTAAEVVPSNSKVRYIKG